jgi:hypothetical protein
LGKFKLEYKVKEGIFISAKTYMLLLEDGSYIIRIKGVNSESLTPKDFMNMYYNSINAEAIKTQSKLSILRGTVNIFDKTVIIKADSYKKRDKIFINDVWVDTQPIKYFMKNDTQHN